MVRVCEPSYKIEELKNEGINVTDLEFDDGTPPPLRVRTYRSGGWMDGRTDGWTDDSYQSTQLYRSGIHIKYCCKQTFIPFMPCSFLHKTESSLYNFFVFL